MKYLVLMIYLIATGVGTLGATQYRDFTSTDGKVIQAMVKSYDVNKKMVTIERDNRKTMKVPITVFSEADQIYIREWELLRCFSVERFLKMSAQRKQSDNDNKSSSDSYQTLKVKDTRYEIRIENRSTSSFSGLKLEYCIYYEQDEGSPGGNVTDQGVFCGDIPFDFIGSKSRTTLKTKAVSTYMAEVSSGVIWTDGRENVQRGGVHGLWVRIYMTLPSGEERVRDFCFPSSLNNSRTWATSSIRVGMN